MTTDVTQVFFGTTTTQSVTNAFTWFNGAEKLTTSVTGTGAVNPGITTFAYDPFGQVDGIANVMHAGWR